MEESNKNLISLRTSLIVVVALLTGGLVGLTLSEPYSFLKIAWMVAGTYFNYKFNQIGKENEIDTKKAY